MNKNNRLAWLGIILIFVSLTIASAVDFSGMTSTIQNKQVARVDYVVAYETCEREKTDIVCSDEPVNKSCNAINKQVEYDCNAYKSPVIVYDDVEENITVNGVTWDFDKYGKCQEVNKQIVCETEWDSDKDGKCEAGESCKVYDFEGNTIQSKSDSEYYNDKLGVYK